MGGEGPARRHVEGAIKWMLNAQTQTDFQDCGNSKIKGNKDVKENGNGKGCKNFQGKYYEV